VVTTELLLVTRAAPIQLPAMLAVTVVVMGLAQQRRHAFVQI